MEKVKQIEHRGVIKKIAGNNLKISIIAKSACLSCQLNTSCSVSDVEEKIIDVTILNPEIYRVGESIDVYFKQTLGYRALFLGYLLPFVIVFSILTITMFLTKNEGISGLTALGALFPYYLILYLKKDKIQKTFSFSIKKSNIEPDFSGVTI
ncbi:MAG: Fis family transcriptional regulator [Bacteroidetes bacterium]|nr:MAG: Fis family transcriptional regulator [Bacteroidota bacterium]